MGVRIIRTYCLRRCQQKIRKRETFFPIIIRNVISCTAKRITFDRDMNRMSCFLCCNILSLVNLFELVHSSVLENDCILESFYHTLRTVATSASTATSISFSDCYNDPVFFKTLE